MEDCDCLLEKVFFAKQLAVSRKTLVVQLRMAFAALQTFRMPCPLKHLENEAIEDQFVTGAAFWYRGCITFGRRGGKS